jgi:signal transduction histidine kinase
LPALPRNALLQVTGVCSSEAGQWEPIRAIRLLLRSTEDVRILAQPPPWESWQVGRILMIGGALGMGALAWIGLLRRRVARRTSELALSNTLLRAEVEERKRAQTELSGTLAAEKELNQLKSQFVSMVSHEFRTPLGVILASADLLSDYLDTLSPEERAEQVADIKQSTRHMAALMEDVLLLGRVESGRMGYHPHNFDLPDFCRRIIDEMMSATNRRCPLEFVEKGIDAPARGDETLLRHILHNLLANGAKYSSPGQPVWLSVEREGDEAVFSVRDGGIGISAEDQKFVFEAFYRGKNIGDRPGSGLGLVVVKRCVEFHAGTIRLQSTPGEGTTVTVRIPLFRAAGQTDFLHRAPATPIPQIL